VAGAPRQRIWLGSSRFVVGQDRPPCAPWSGFLGAVRTVVQVPARQLTFEGKRWRRRAVAGAFRLRLRRAGGRGRAVDALECGCRPATGPPASSVDLGWMWTCRRGPGGLPVGRWRPHGSGCRHPAAQTGGQALCRCTSFAVTGTSEERRRRDGTVTADYQLGSLGRGGADLRSRSTCGSPPGASPWTRSLRIQAAGGGGDRRRGHGSRALRGARRGRCCANAVRTACQGSLGSARSAQLRRAGGARRRSRSSCARWACGPPRLRNAQAALQRLQGRRRCVFPEVVLAALLRQQGGSSWPPWRRSTATPSSLPPKSRKEARAVCRASRSRRCREQILVRDAGALAFRRRAAERLLTVNGKSIPLASSCTHHVPRPLIADRLARLSRDTRSARMACQSPPSQGVRKHRRVGRACGARPWRVSCGGVSIMRSMMARG